MHYKMKLKSWHGNTAYLLCKKVQTQTSYGKVYNGYEVVAVYGLFLNDYLFKNIVTYVSTERHGKIGLYYTENELAVFDENEKVKITL